jgi:hypothetical protein
MYQSSILHTYLNLFPFIFYVSYLYDNNSCSELENSTKCSLNESTESLFSEFKSEVIMSLDYSSLNEILFYLFLMLLFCFLTFNIFKQSKLINLNIGSGGLAAFSKSFKFYFLISFLFFIYFLISLLNSLFFNVLLLNFYMVILIVIFFLFFIFVWCGRAYLLYSVSLKYYEEKLSLKFSNKTFLFINFFMIFIDFVISIIIINISDIIYLFYNVLVMLGFIIFAFKKIEFKNISKHLPYVTIVLLLILRFTGSFDFILTSEDSTQLFDLFIDFITVTIYAYILYKLIKWRKKFEK